MLALAGWENFGVIVGSSAGALIGLQFVVMTLMAEAPLVRGEAELVGNAFATPTVVHFGSVLFLSAIFSAPWGASEMPVILSGLTGVGGMAYCVIVVRRQTLQTTYKPVLEDWLFYFLAPFISYLLLVAMAFCTGAYPTGAFFGIAAAQLGLLFAGIHNAWDSVSYSIYLRQAKPRGRRRHQ